MTIREYLNRVEHIKKHLWLETERIIMANEEEIVNLNRLQISKHENTLGNTLENIDNPPFTGYYAKDTERRSLINDPYPSLTTKNAGFNYNFVWSGKFFKEFRIIIAQNKKSFTIYSDGIKTSVSKYKFFKGYSYLFGLTKKNEIKVNNEIIHPKLLEYINKNL